MEAEDINKRLDELIKTITDRNKTTQEQKQSGPGGWIAAVVLALLSLIGIGVALYLANKKAKELAMLKTKIEQDKVDQDQQVHEAAKEPLRRKQEELLAHIKQKEAAIQVEELHLKEAQDAYLERKKKIDALKSWDEINEI